MDFFNCVPKLGDFTPLGSGIFNAISSIRQQSISAE